MLSYEVMGVLALWVLWINTGLIAAAALIDLARLSRPFSGFQRLDHGATGLGFVRGTIETLHEGQARFAKLAIRRTGRRADGAEPAIHFGAQRPESTLLGGVVQLGQHRVQVEAAACRVWFEPAQIEARLSEVSPAEFASAVELAEKRRGFEKCTELGLGVGETVYLGGRFESGPGGVRLAPAEDTPVLVSAFDPLAFLRRQRGLTFGFVLAIIVVLGGITALALSAPRFGPLSKLGGVLGLAYFLLVLPAATWFRERTRAPDLKSYFGEWRVQRDSSAANRTFASSAKLGSSD